jgi:hypothetical protein
MTVSTPTPEEYFQKWLAPLHLLTVLSDINLCTPRFIRIGKNWIKDDAGFKKKIAPDALERRAFVGWLKAEIYNSIERGLSEDIDFEAEESDPADWPVKLDQIENPWGNKDPWDSEETWNRSRQLYDPSLVNNQNHIRWFWNRNDPAVIMERLEDKGLWDWSRVSRDAPRPQTNGAGDLLLRIKSESSPQARQYIDSLERLLAKDTDPSDFEDRELSALIEISSQRIRQLRHGFNKKYRRAREQLRIRNI